MSSLAEVIRSSTRQFEAEVYTEQTPPAFGHWVHVDMPDGTRLYSLVSFIEVGPLESNRRATALGMDEDALRREMPHVIALLRTTLTAQILAFRTPDGRIHQTLPPHPAPIHGFVYPTERDEIVALSAPYDYLRTLVVQATPGTPTDDLLVAALRQLNDAHLGGPDGRRALIAAGRTLSRLMDDDHTRLQSILRRVQNAG